MNVWGGECLGGERLTIYISYLQLVVERGAKVLVDMRIIVPGNLLFEICHLSSFIIDRQS